MLNPLLLLAGKSSGKILKMPEWTLFRRLSPFLRLFVVGCVAPYWLASLQELGRLQALYSRVGSELLLLFSSPFKPLGCVE